MRRAENGCELQSRKSNVSAAALRSAHIRVATLSTSSLNALRTPYIIPQKRKPRRVAGSTQLS